MQNGVAVNGADEVTVDGFMARGYKANGFFFTNVNGYTMDHLIARQTGVYGLYAFNSIGGKIAELRGLLRQRRRVLHRPDAAAVQADPHDGHATSPAGAARSGSAPRTCAT